ncbi:Hypothetical protein PHPALM_37884 [Phytophthora palmivora]|uniref:Reverse transcriptase domain-containing protein n=1 Tax=Phytophthora palmivora TaxID=4796 RepID=A0A2P4WWA3_9STRA|nr:Hypothetical protein PHPALM_37884 [Phytophthora palmivora]
MGVCRCSCPEPRLSTKISTIDYRPVNKVTVPIGGSMPNLAVVSSGVRGTKLFAKFDMTKGFWQLPLDVDSQELMSLNGDTMYAPTRVPQGAVDSAIDFQMQMQDVMTLMIQRNALVLVDDVIVFAHSTREFLQALKKFSLSSVTDCYQELAIPVRGRWCDQLISGDGVHHDPESVDALTALSVPYLVVPVMGYMTFSQTTRE